jgi:hypothetical protein
MAANPSPDASRFATATLALPDLCRSATSVSPLK